MDAVNNNNYNSYNVSRNVSRKRKMQRKKKRRRLKIRLKLLLIIVAFSATIIAVALSPLFNIKTIKVIGDKSNGEENLIAASGIVIGSNGFKTIGKSIKNIFMLRSFEAEQSILKTFSNIKDVKVSFWLPSTFKITVAERIPAAKVENMGIYWLIDSEGYIIRMESEGENNELPLIRGLEYEKYEPRQTIITKSVKGLNTANMLLKEISKCDAENSSFVILDNIGFIDVSDVNNILLNINSRITVNLGDTLSLNYKIKYIKEIYPRLSAEDRGYLGFSFGDNPVFQPNK